MISGNVLKNARALLITQNRLYGLCTEVSSSSCVAALIATHSVCSSEESTIKRTNSRVATPKPGN